MTRCGCRGGVRARRRTLPPAPPPRLPSAGPLVRSGGPDDVADPYRPTRDDVGAEIVARRADMVPSYRRPRATPGRRGSGRVARDRRETREEPDDGTAEARR